MKQKTKLIILVVLFILVNFFISKRINIKLDNLVKDIFLYPYHILKLDKVLNKDNNFLLSELNNKEKEINDLKELLRLKTISSSYEIINATVISRNMEYFYDEIIIDKGKKDGILLDMAVVTEKGLIGKTVKVNRNNSVIKLLTSTDLYNMLSVQIEVDESYVYGILNAYDEKTNSFVVEGIDQNIKIKDGSLVSTTGLGNIYPAGVVIGKVVRIQKDNFDLSYILKVESFIDFEKFNYVAVLNRIIDD